MTVRRGALVVSLIVIFTACGERRMGASDAATDAAAPPTDSASGFTCVSYCSTVTARCTDAGTAAQCVMDNCLDGHEDDRIATLGCGDPFRAMLACYEAHGVCDIGTMGSRACPAEVNAVTDCVNAYCAAHPGPPEC